MIHSKAACLDELDDALRGRLTAVIDEGWAIWERFDSEVRHKNWHPFVPADYERMHPAMLALRAPRAVLAMLMLAAAACAHPTSDTSPRPAPRFYTGKTYGTESQFNPLTEILNEGFDEMRTNASDRHVFSRQYGRQGAHIWDSFVHADRTFAFYGYRRALVNEWLPLTLSNSTGGGAWVPNYEYHLFGSGMVSVKLKEWYEQHEVGHPQAMAALTLMSAHYLGEIIENHPLNVPDEDATTDLLIFDIGGLLLWRVDAVQRLFSGPLQLTNWPGQPAIDLPSGTMQNARQQFILRTPLPFTSKWKLFYDIGMSSLLGTSRQLANGDAVSVGVGTDAVDNPVVDTRTGARSATLRFKSGLFYDRQGSLLWSVMVGSRSDVSTVDVNVYPGVLRVGGVSPGLWMHLPPAGGVRIGIATSFGFGLGYGPER